MPNEIFLTKIHSSSSYKTSGRKLRMARATKALPTLIQTILSLVRQFKSSHGRVARVLAPTLNTHTLSMYNVMLCSHTVVSVVWLHKFGTVNTHGGYMLLHVLRVHGVMNSPFIARPITVQHPFAACFFFKRAPVVRIERGTFFLTPTVYSVVN